MLLEARVRILYVAYFVHEALQRFFDDSLVIPRELIQLGEDVDQNKY